MIKIPPLTTLRVFEAAARNMNFTKAADELCVTQAAISHQIKKLEEWLGVKLFLRHGHQLQLTKKGTTYSREITNLFLKLSDATEILHQNQQHTVNLTVLPSFASCWLIPRLPSFKKAHPEIDIKINTSLKIWPFQRNDFDLAIRSGHGQWNAVQADLISHESYTPLCHPAYAAKHKLAQPDDLSHCCRLYDKPKNIWRQWLKIFDIVECKTSSQLFFNDHAIMLQSAVLQQGVAMGRLFLASQSLKDSLLIRLFEENIKNDYSYWLCYRPETLNQKAVALFREWLLMESSSTKQQGISCINVL